MWDEVVELSAANTAMRLRTIDPFLCIDVTRKLGKEEAVGESSLSAMKGLYIVTIHETGKNTR